jgi:hypothetical protein
MRLIATNADLNRDIANFLLNEIRNCWYCCQLAGRLGHFSRRRETRIDEVARPRGEIIPVAQGNASQRAGVAVREVDQQHYCTRLLTWMHRGEACIRCEILIAIAPRRPGSLQPAKIPQPFAATVRQWRCEAVRAWQVADCRSLDTVISLVDNSRGHSNHELDLPVRTITRFCDRTRREDFYLSARWFHHCGLRDSRTEVVQRH